MSSCNEPWSNSCILIWFNVSFTCFTVFLWNWQPNPIIANFWHVNAFSGMIRVLVYFSKLTFYLCGTKNPPIKHPYFVLKSHQSPTFLVLCSYFSYKLFWKMAGPYGLWAPTWRPEINRNVCYWVLLQKREFISRGYHKHLSHTFSDTWTVQIAKFPDISHFFKPAWQLSRPSGKCRVA